MNEEMYMVAHYRRVVIKLFQCSSIKCVNIGLSVPLPAHLFKDSQTGPAIPLLHAMHAESFPSVLILSLFLFKENESYKGIDFTTPTNVS